MKISLNALRSKLPISRMLFSALFLMVVSPANATDISKDYCLPFYQGIHNVALVYQQDTPFKNVDWKDVVQKSARFTVPILKEGGIPLTVLGDVTAMPAELAEDTIYIKIIYSYVDKEKFSLKSDIDYTATWIETTRKLKKPDGGFDVIVRKAPVAKFMPANKDSSNFILLDAAFGLLEGDACAALHYSGGKRCTNIRDLGKNKIIPVEPCIEGKPDYPPEVEEFLNKSALEKSK